MAAEAFDEDIVRDVLAEVVDTVVDVDRLMGDMVDAVVTGDMVRALGEDGQCR
jgi:hypothetical protein